jgi:hypothetical protein
MMNYMGLTPTADTAGISNAFSICGKKLPSSHDINLGFQPVFAVYRRAMAKP